MRWNARGAAALAAAAVLLAGCAAQVNGTAARGTGQPATTAASTATSSSSTTTRSSTSSASTSAESTPASSGVQDSSVPATTDATGAIDIGQFGQAYAWTNGLEITVAPGVAFTPGPYASTTPAAAYLSYAITITNKSGQPYDPTMFTASAQSAGKESESVYDSDSGLTGSPTTSVLDGRDATFAIGFGVADPADVVVEISPGYDYDSALFATEGALAVVAPPAAEPLITGSGQAKFGQTYGWPAGLEVSVAPAVPFTPSETSSADPAAAYASFTVTITNRTGAPYDPTEFFASATSGGKEADQIFDSANGFVGSPTTAVLNGRGSSFVIGFGVENAADVVMEVSPGYDYDGKAIFTS